MARKLKIIFYGTPDFAVSSLREILDADFEVLAVVTAPDRRSGRGMKLTPSAVKTFALSRGLDVLQPTNLKSEEFQTQLRQYSPNIQVVIAFRMMPEKVWNFPDLGTINLHASLLPNYRGAAPINWAVINGETHTGVSTFRLKHEIDTGNILGQREVAIEQSDTAGTMHDKLMKVGAELMVETLHSIEKNEEVEIEQIVQSQHKNAPKIFKEDCVLNWDLGAHSIFNLIRGLSPYPVARTSIGNKTLKVFEADILDQKRDNQKPGTILTDNKTFIHVVTNDYLLKLKVVQLEGKRRMEIDEFLRGFDMDSTLR